MPDAEAVLEKSASPQLGSRHLGPCCHCQRVELGSSASGHCRTGRPALAGPAPRRPHFGCSSGTDVPSSARGGGASQQQGSGQNRGIPTTPPVPAPILRAPDGTWCARWRGTPPPGGSGPGTERREQASPGHGSSAASGSVSDEGLRGVDGERRCLPGLCGHGRPGLGYSPCR